MNILDYIVPIFYKSEFNGSGFIVGTVLVTAAHVVISEKSSFSIMYRGQKIPIGPEKNIIFEC